QVIGDQVRMDAGFAHHLGKRVVERLQRAPAAMHEVQAPGMKITTRRHAGKASDEVRIECDRALGEAVEIGRSNAGRAIAADRGSHQRVEKDKNRAHESLPGGDIASMPAWRRNGNGEQRCKFGPAGRMADVSFATAYE